MSEPEQPKWNVCNNNAVANRMTFNAVKALRYTHYLAARRPFHNIIGRLCEWVGVFTLRGQVYYATQNLCEKLRETHKSSMRGQTWDSCNLLTRILHGWVLQSIAYMCPNPLKLDCACLASQVTYWMFFEVKYILSVYKLLLGHNDRAFCLNCSRGLLQSK